MADLCERVERAALLHDLGKLVLRANPAQETHSEAGAKFLARFLHDEDADLLRAVRHHHADELRGLHAEADDISYIVYEADNLAAASDRRTLEEGGGGFSATANLESVFNLFGGSAAQRERDAFYLRGLAGEGERMQFPHAQEGMRASVSEYQELYQHLEANFLRRSPSDMQINELLRVLEGILSYVPSSTARAEAADISLYDHVRLTAAYAAAMYRYFSAHGIADYRRHATGEGGRAMRKEKMYLLVSGDVSGIQPFIYAIPSKGALKSLRGRSFYLEILLENVVDEILTACSMSRSALLYTGGGHFYLLLPNTEAVQDVLRKYHEAVNDWMMRHFGAALYLAMAWTPCAAEEFRGEEAADSGHGTQEAFRRVSEALAGEKLSRYSAQQLAALFSPASSCNRVLDAGRECSICHTSSTELVAYRGEEGADACPMCANLYLFGERILTEDVFCVSLEKHAEALPLPGLGREMYLSAESLASVENLPYAAERLYIKNKIYTGERLATHLWLGDYTARREGRVMEFAELADASGGAQESAGIRRLGVLRADVDNLGAAFLAGFPEKYATLTRTAVLSRQLSLFFKHYINALCRGEINGVGESSEEKFSLFGREKKRERDIHIVYSGGDDIFLLGAWDDVVEFAVDLRRAFWRFTSGRLHFSAGIGFFKEKIPVAEMARKAGELESLAKSRPGKDAVALFGTASEERGEGEGRAQVYGWDDFIDGVCGEKLAFLQQNFSFDDPKAGARIFLGKSAAYRLLDLVESEGTSVQLARFAYVLARLDPGAKAESQEAYQRIRRQFYEWYKRPKDRQELATALQFVLYSIREKGARTDG
ncbi:MAG: type III-A CRISPR-associated protein Cas10/Csm1 [Selenomonas sp.]